MNRGILQTDHRLKDAINKQGCAFRAVGAMVEDFLDEELSPKQINAAYDGAVLAKYMTPSCYVRTWKGLIEEFAGVLGNARLTGYDFGIIYPGQRPDYWPWVDALAEVDRPDVDYYLDVWNADNPDGTHFTTANSDGRMIFDPWPTDVRKDLRHALLINIFETA